MKMLMMLVVGMVVSLGVVASGAEEQEVALPASVTLELQKMDAAIKDAKVKAINTLSKILTDETKKGNLKGANAIDAQIQALKDSTNESSAASQDVASALVGKWNATVSTGYHLVYTFERNNKASSSDGSAGKWVTKGNKIVVTWLKNSKVTGVDIWEFPRNNKMNGANEKLNVTISAEKTAE